LFYGNFAGLYENCGRILQVSRKNPQFLEKKQAKGEPETAAIGSSVFCLFCETALFWAV
jgi:hypothetical protein